jgi:hypothetical protein
MATKISKYYLTQLVQKLGAKNHKILFLIYQSAAYMKNTIILSNIKVIFLPANCTTQPHPLYLGITHEFISHYRKQLILKTAAMTDGGMLQDTAHMKLDTLSAMHLIAEIWRLMTPTTIRNCFVKCGFLTDHITADDSAVKLTQDEEDGWHSIQPLGMQSEDHPTCDMTLRTRAHQGNWQLQRNHNF